jgi:hypothetical protein
MSIRVLVIADREIPRYRDYWLNMGIASVWIGREVAMQLILAPAKPDFIFDAIIIFGEGIDGEGDAHLDHVRVLYVKGEQGGAKITPSGGEERDSNSSVPPDFLLAAQVSALPPGVAMFDGKQWRAIPVFVFPSSIPTCHSFLDEPYLGYKLGLIRGLPGADIKSEVEKYREAILSEYDNLGFIVRYESGRYVVGQALRSHAGIQGRYYFGPADKRPKGFFTVHRDRWGIQLEVEQFEALINREDISESALQQFLEEHPHFLSALHTVLPKPRLPKHDGSILIPDFILKPICAQQRDSRWEILDLKLPNVKLLSGTRGSRKRLSSKVMDAIRQLRDYREHLMNPQHTETVATLLGHPLKRPQLGVLIGRLANTDIEALEREQEYEADVRIVTYDEILEGQAAQI